MGLCKRLCGIMWLIMQQDKPDDYIITTGEQHSVKEFCELAFEEVGIKIKWEGEGISEKGIDEKTDEVVMEVDPRIF
ncbi:GDP-mannose 4,6-dehydratase [Fusobacterium varium]|uniref:GDP-mannose 4,6-dehydratase n=1 Tax=Fusobacterium varium TaxID=856 RepID=UPI002FF365D2